MKKIKWDIFGLAIMAAASISGIGIAIGEQSILGILACIAVLSFAMREGFKRKKKGQKKH
ncbi:hypothetical protein DRW41_02390 [Neobacillus piezotolerans]|uniref:YlaF family protein n=1 Tax=Neobacillus piezotolerans TaxID=2259171 RepID=A0A3D8GVP0_9BACI|nr:DUF5325 family protein [Neobacillus piezotolerans]RDU38432.1 hypothetical protein DRW41_02390 [Neobacillus piezotolerans]